MIRSTRIEAPVGQSLMGASTFRRNARSVRPATPDFRLLGDSRTERVFATLPPSSVYYWTPDRPERASRARGAGRADQPACPILSVIRPGCVQLFGRAEDPRGDERVCDLILGDRRLAVCDGCRCVEQRLRGFDQRGRVAASSSVLVIAGVSQSG